VLIGGYQLIPEISTEQWAGSVTRMGVPPVQIGLRRIGWEGIGRTDMTAGPLEQADGRISTH
jgi:hypothetical protein